MGATRHNPMDEKTLTSLLDDGRRRRRVFRLPDGTLSIQLEQRLWESLDKIAARERMMVGTIIAQLNATYRQHTQPALSPPNAGGMTSGGKASHLSPNQVLRSAIWVFVITYYRTLMESGEADRPTADCPTQTYRRALAAVGG